MEDFGEQYCALCVNTISDGNFKEIQVVTRDIFEVILLKVDFDGRSKQVICNICSLAVMEAFKFKSMCLYTDYTIIPYVDDETGCSVSLMEIYTKENGIEQSIETMREQKVCRLCFQLIRAEFISVHDVNIDMIECYIPEINFSVTEDPVLCRHCFDSFDIHSSFVKRCSEVEKKVKSIQPSLISSIKTDIKIKSEASDQEEELSKIESTIMKTEKKEMSIKAESIEIKTEENNEESDAPDYESELEGVSEVDKIKCKPKRHMLKRKKGAVKKIHTCEKCDYKTVFKNHFTNHQLIHENVPKTKKEGCPSYEAKKKSPLLSHRLHDKNSSEVNRFKCIYCDYKAKRKGVLREHYITNHEENLLDPKENSKIKQMLNLRYPLPVKIHKCDICPYTAINKKKLLNHRCKLPLKCYQCSYTTQFKFQYTAHQMMHENPSNMEMYKCHNCNYETKYKNRLTKHQLKHKNPEQVQMHKCIYCNYEAKCKGSLRSHLLLIHADFLYDPKENLRVQGMLNFRKPISLKMYKCDKCIYETLNKTAFNAHQLIHRDRSHVRMYTCEVCDFETKYKKSLDGHKMTHAEELNFKCHTCRYATKQKKQLARHKLTHLNIAEVRMYKCHNCDYESKYKGHLARHQLKHQNPEQVQMHKCIYCSYESKHKESLSSHIEFNHRDKLLDPEENSKVTRMLNRKKIFSLESYKCDKCSFETPHRSILNGHLLTHKDRSQVRMYMCNECGYESKRKYSLTKHKLIHKSPAEVQLYKCDTCNYAAKGKSALKRHQLTHNNNIEVQMYKCRTCNYKSKFKRRLEIHQLRHKSPSKEKMYTCDTKMDNVKPHQLMNKNASEIEMYKCNNCDYETRYKSNLIRHLLQHKSPSNIRMYMCESCDFKSESKKCLINHKLMHKNPS
ncbi:zinc finger protein 761-like [Anoplophora glabripennis]|uniref:zinc finger protein 761-like n=1 Tax=Anoplophora glabripennis TaxID=217634 RepID=UPI0008749EC8|nr:zinc finger protein 761-like [Anoplophora glabripennis]